MTVDLVGRAAEQRQLHALVRSATRHFRWLHVLGEPGIGKTRMLSELAMLAEQAGFLVAVGRGSGPEVDVPFGVLVDALDDYLGSVPPERLERFVDGTAAELAGIFPSLSGRSPAPARGLGDERYRTYRTVRGLVENLARVRPLALLLDDVHWADEASRQLITFLTRRPPQGPVLLAIAWRPGAAPDLAPDLAAAARDAHGARIELGPLGRADATALLGRPPTDDEMTTSGGNPFYLLQLSRHASADRVAVLGRPGREERLPAAVSLAIADELGALSPEARLLAQAAAVVSDPVDMRSAVATAALDDDTGLIALDELVAAEVLRQTHQPTRFRFRQPIVRQAVYDATAPGWRLGAHRRLAALLAADHAPAAMQARHVALTAAPGDETALGILIEAAQDAQSRAPATAAEWWSAALRTLPPNSAGSAERRLSLLAPYAAASAARGDLETALAALEEALALVGDTGPVAAQLAAACAGIEHGLGRFEAARGRLQTALAAADAAESDSGSGSGAVRFVLEKELAVAQLFVRDFAGARDWAARAATSAPSGDDQLVVRALAAYVLSSAEDYAAAQQEVSIVAADFDDVPDRLTGKEVPRRRMSARRTAAYYLGSAEFLIGKYEAAATHLATATSSVDPGRNRVLLPALREMARTLVALGRLDEAADTADMAVDLARITCNDWLTAYALAAAAEVRLAQGNLAGALEHAEEAARLTSPDAHHFRDGLRRLGALVHAEAGRYAACMEALRDTGAPEFPVTEPGTRWTLHELTARAAAHAHDAAAADEAAGRAQAAAEQAGVPAAVMSAARARAEALLATGAAPQACDVLEEAIATGVAAGAVLDTARTRILAGRALAEADREDQARATLLLAEAALRDAGARLWRDAAARQLRQLGVAAPGRALSAAVPAARTSGSSLSGREREIAARVLAGQSNREIAAALYLSEKTIEGHLRRLYGKLGIRRRGALAAALEAHDKAAAAN